MAKKYIIPEVAFAGDIAILGRKGMGKTHAAMTMVARLIETGRQVVIVDPISSWWGVKHSADMKSAGLPVVHFGQQRADVEINVGMGETVARFVLGTRHSLLIETGHMIDDDAIVFMSAFLSTLFREKVKQEEKVPLWIVLEEADEFAPQSVGEMRPVYQQLRRIVRQGRAHGFKTISVTQRTATLNKNLLTQISTLVAFGAVADLDINAMKAWVGVQGDERSVEMLGTLRELTKGEAWVWVHNVSLERIVFPPIKTYDSTFTPLAPIGRRPSTIDAPTLAMVREQIAVLSEGGNLLPATTPATSRRRSERVVPQYATALSAARIGAGLTQDELGARMLIGQGNVARMEGGRGNPTIETLAKAAEAMGSELVVSFAAKRKSKGE